MSEPPQPKPSPQLRVAVRTDIGMRRATNQDSVAVVPSPNGAPIDGDAFLMVADGMGAHAAGELASKMAADAIPHAYLKSSSDSAPTALRTAIRDANDAIYRKGCSSPDFGGMGTTCSCLVATRGAVLVGHVGDSRVYRFRRGALEQLTFDHSLVWEMAAASKVSADKVPSCIPKNVITRSLGPHESVNVDLEGPHRLEPGDVFLLCSDGLTGVVGDELAGGVIGAMEPDEAAETLVNLANLRGGPDNISVIVARAESGEACECETPECKPGRHNWGVGMAAICAIACGYFLMDGHAIGAVGAAIGLGASIAYAWSASRSPAPNSPAERSLTGAYGNGPYRRTECDDLAAASQELREIVQELASLDASDQSDTVQAHEAACVGADSPPPAGVAVLDWEPHRERHQEAEAAFERGDHKQAIVAYGRIVKGVMDSFRRDDGTHRYRASQEVTG